MNVAVTGANGFLGSHLAEELVRDGHRVHALCQPGTPLDNIGHLDVEIHESDVRDLDSVQQAVKGCETVYHLAAIPSDWASAGLLMEVNAGGTRNLVRACLKEGARRLVLMSSLAVHASTGHLDDDENAPRDRTDMPYALSKRLAEDYVLDPELDGKLEGVVIRPGLLPFGPRDQTTFFKMARALKAGRMPVTGLGDTVLCTVYARNLAFGTALAGQNENAPGQVFVITDDVKTTWKAILDRFADALGARRIRLCIPGAVAQATAMVVESAWDAFKVKAPPPVTRYRVGITLKDFHFTCDKAKRVLGYSPPVIMDQAIHETAAWFLAAEPNHK